MSTTAETQPKQFNEYETNLFIAQLEQQAKISELRERIAKANLNELLYTLKYSSITNPEVLEGDGNEEPVEEGIDGAEGDEGDVPVPPRQKLKREK
jgi:hypothetical protein